MGGLQLTVLGIVGEYLAAVFDEVKRRPLYIVDEVIGQTAQLRIDLTTRFDRRTRECPGTGSRDAVHARPAVNPRRDETHLNVVWPGGFNQDASDAPVNGIDRRRLTIHGCGPAREK